MDRGLKQDAESIQKAVAFDGEQSSATAAGLAALAQLVDPMPVSTFINDYWARKFLHLPGRQDKFSWLFSWELLNRTLEQHRFSGGRVAMVKAGKGIEARVSGTTNQVNSRTVLSEVSNGATLLLRNCDEVHQPLRLLCEVLERMCHVYVYVNLYAGIRTDHGFDVHWDDQDNLILQVSGKKHWRVWAPTRSFPFKVDVVDTSVNTRPTGPPQWEGVLEQGELLNIPRGWWHVAAPIDSPCLHLTVTVRNLNGIDLITWLAHRMKSNEIARSPVPIFSDEQDRKRWMDSVWRALSDMWTPSIIDMFLGDVDRLAPERPIFALPATLPDRT